MYIIPMKRKLYPRLCDGPIQAYRFVFIGLSNSKIFTTYNNGLEV